MGAVPTYEEREIAGMDKTKKEALFLAGMCAVAVLLSLAGLIWALFGRGLGFSLDAIFLILTCLMTGGLFSLMLFVELKSGGLLPPLKMPGKKQADSSAGSEEEKK